MRRTASAVSLLVLLAVAGCTSGSGSASTAAGASTGGAGASASATSPSSTPAPAPATATGSVTTLPESVLPALAGYRYITPPGGDVVPAGIARAGAVFDGFIARGTTRGGTAAGSVEVIRALPAAQAQLDALLPDIARSFGQVTPAPGFIGTQPVLLLEKMRGTPGGAAVFHRENTIVIISAQSGLAEARRMATLYLAAA